ncbi:MAG: hypothetical protein LBS76_05015 [Mycoplasmataceae bacterium]|jgi:hypothetical protein|nr:hypothetical protein [Mycoplasmataceae bacterium]
MKNLIQKEFQTAINTNKVLYGLGFENIDAQEFVKMKRNELRLKKLAYENIQSKVNALRFSKI